MKKRQVTVVTRQVYLDHNGREFPTAAEASRSVRVAALAEFLQEHGGHYDPDYIAAAEALVDAPHVRVAIFDSEVPVVRAEDGE